ncbi:MAG: putative toxin-antitoxin system toxin component, PIN family [Alphaproteobacteria bacterium]
MSRARFVLDTDVIVAAMRSPKGASAAIVLAAMRREATLLLSVPLAIEYESKCTDKAHRAAAGLSRTEAQIFVDTLLASAEPVTIYFLWRPQLLDPNDEMVLETAVNGRADAIVTFNTRHFTSSPERFGLEILLPRDALKRISA